MDKNDHKYRECNDIGEIKIPNNFRYADTVAKGKPAHEKFDAFYSKHPFMSIAQRAKIFSPFDALRGFNEAVTAKETLYQPKVILENEQIAELNDKLTLLQKLIDKDNRSKQYRTVVEVTYFVPCSDKNSESYGYRGQYTTITGICTKVDSVIGKTITVENTIIEMIQILQIEILQKDPCNTIKEDIYD